MEDAEFYINHLNLRPHPEGGFYAETYRSAGSIPANTLKEFGGARSYSTAIYYLLKQDEYSAFHRIKSDECWHYYTGHTLLIHILYSNGDYNCIRLGSAIDTGEALQYIVPANTWFAAECAANSRFVLTGCTVAPGFDFADFEMADEENLSLAFPQQTELISRLCKHEFNQRVNKRL
jgi:predicted cupin superfamily sugar epimerase